MTTVDPWRLPDDLWERIAPLWPAGKPHPVGCHRPRVDNRRAMDASGVVVRTGCQWNALNATGSCASRSAHRRGQEWTAAGVFRQRWVHGLAASDDLVGSDWAWLAMDGAMTTAPLGGGDTRAHSHRPRQGGHHAQRADRGRGCARRAGGGRGQPP